MFLINPSLHILVYITLLGPQNSNEKQKLNSITPKQSASYLQAVWVSICQVWVFIKRLYAVKGQLGKHGRVAYVIVLQVERKENSIINMKKYELCTGQIE